jgi:hypothetical protein
MMSIRVLADLAAARKAWPLASGPLGSTRMVTDTTRPGLRLQGVDGQEPQGVVGRVGDLGPLDVESMCVTCRVLITGWYAAVSWLRLEQDAASSVPDSPPKDTMGHGLGRKSD